MNIFERLLEICDTVFDGEIDTATIKPEALLREDVGINSVGILYMALALEEEFGIKFTNDDFIDIKTVADVVSVIERKVS